MSSTLSNFQDKYGLERLEKKGLVIGGYESAFLENQLYAAYVFKVTNNQLKKFLWKGIYRYDVLLVLKGKISKSDIRIWKDKSQEKINEIAGNKYIHFTCETWYPRVRPSRNETKTNSMVTEKVSHYLTSNYLLLIVDSKNLKFIRRKTNYSII